MQSATADVNAGVVSYRTMLAFAIDSRNMANAEAAIAGLNGILPMKLKVRFDDKEYARQTRTAYLIACPVCDEESPIESEHIKTRITTPALGGYWSEVDPDLVRTTRYLTCGAKSKGKVCGAEIEIPDNDADDRVVAVPAEDVPESADRAGVAYAPLPPVISSLHDQSLHAAHYWAWVRIVLGLIENQLRAFRESVSTAHEVETEGEAE